MAGAGVTWELIFVDDGSTDRSAKVIEQLAAADDRVRGLPTQPQFRSRSGKHGGPGLVVHREQARSYIGSVFV